MARLQMKRRGLVGVVSVVTVGVLVLVAFWATGVNRNSARTTHHLDLRLAANASSTNADASATGSLGQSDGVEDVFWKGAGGVLMHTWYMPGLGWQPAQSMGGAMYSGPDPVASGNGVMDVFWEGLEGNLWHVWYVGGTWYGPSDLGMGPLASAPHAVSPQTGVIGVFWRGTDGGLWYGRFVGGAWYGPDQLLPAGSLLSDPDPVSDADGAIQVFYKGWDGAAHEMSYAWQWSNQPTLPSGPIGSTPHAAVVGANQIDLVWQGTDGGLWYDLFGGAAWAGPYSGSAGALGSQPHPVSTVSGRADVYWQGTDGWLWEEHVSNGIATGLQRLPTGAMASEPDPGLLAPGEDIFWRGTDGGIWHERGDGLSSWAGPVRIAAPPPSSLSLAVPFYHQQESLTCEEAALRMALAYFGISVSEQAVLSAEGVDLVHYWTGPGGGDPFADFVGNPNGSEIANTGYGAYWSAILRAATDLGGSAAYAGMGLSPVDVYNAVFAGEPVIFWVPFDWDTPGRADYTAFDGRSIPYAGPEEHAMLVIGASPSEVEVNDPDRGQYWVTWSQFDANFAVYGDMAVVIR